MNRFTWGIGVILILCGCRSQSEKSKAGENEPTAPASSAANIRKRTNTDPITGTAQKLLGEGEVRVALLVLPGDALVELDNVPVRRRNGMVELVGKVGEERRVEVFLDAATTIEKTVKIEAAGVSPAFIDAEEESKAKSGPAKSPVVFDNDE